MEDELDADQVDTDCPLSVAGAVHEARAIAGSLEARVGQPTERDVAWQQWAAAVMSERQSRGGQ